MSQKLNPGAFIDQLSEEYLPDAQTLSINDFVYQYYANIFAAYQKKMPWEHLAKALSDEYGDDIPVLKGLKASTLKQYFYRCKAYLEKQKVKSPSKTSRRRSGKKPVIPTAAAPAEQKVAVPEASAADSDGESKDISFAEFAASPSSHTTVPVDSQPLSN